ncbi:MAG: haloalkane dehalogenase [Candidatus Hydrogenedentes bacterium]|nr:haloalkane dehalogenase [Candidatus Hydrogenedentota bacterium]
MCGAAVTDEVRPGVLRTPDERFENLPGFDFEPHYADIDGYRIHYLDEGPADGEPVLLLHGEPTWSYLYRKMVPVLTEAGFRCIVPDLIGFGRSDKPTSMDVHTYKFHVDAIAALVEELDLQNVTFFGQDWGGLIGLRVVAENEARFARVVIANTGLPTGVGFGVGESSAFMQWKKMNQAMIDRGDIPTGAMVSGSVGDPSLKAAYDAPFPDPSYKAGALIMPQRVPVTPDDPAREANEAAWEVFRQWKKPFLTAFSDGDPITRGGDAIFQQSVPGAKGQAHTTIEGAGHFLQEQAGETLAQVIVKFIADNPLPKRTAMLTADDIPVAHTPPGYWETMPPPILEGCGDALAEGAIDMRGLWEVVESTLNGQPSKRLIGSRQRIEQCGNRVVVTSGGVVHDMHCDGTFENGVNDIGGPTTGGRPIIVAASFENGVHILRPKGMPNFTVEREVVDGDLIWRYGPSLVLRLKRIDTK